MLPIDRLKMRTKETDEALLLDCLESARAVILSRRFPYGTTMTDVEPRYVDLQYRIALAIYDKDGAEYETGHSENGISRSWASESVPESLIREIVPMCGVM